MGFIVTKPFEVFNDLKGNPLENGKLFIGLVDLNPKTNPVAVFFDEALTIPADQPIRTIGGYPSQNGTPANIYIENTNYSITVDDKNDKFIYSRLDSDNISDEVLGPNIISDLTAITKASLADNQQALVGGYNIIGDGGGGPFFWDSTSTEPADNGLIFETDEGGTGRWKRVINSTFINVKGFGATGDGVTDDTTAIQAAINEAEFGNGTIYFPTGVYITTSTILVGRYIDLRGEGQRATFITGDGDFDIFEFVHPADGIFRETVVSNMGITSTASTGTGRGVYLNNPARVVFRNVRIANHKGKGVFAERNTNFDFLLSFYDCFFSNNGDWGTDIDNCNSAQFFNCSWQSNVGELRFDGQNINVWGGFIGGTNATSGGALEIAGATGSGGQSGGGLFGVDFENNGSADAHILLGSINNVKGFSVNNCFITNPSGQGGDVSCIQINKTMELQISGGELFEAASGYTGTVTGIEFVSGAGDNGVSIRKVLMTNMDVEILNTGNISFIHETGNELIHVGKVNHKYEDLSNNTLGYYRGLARVVADTTTSGTTETTFGTVTIPAGDFPVDGGVRIRVAGTKTNGSAENKDIKIYFGSGAETVINDSNTADDWSAELTVINVDATTNRFTYTSYDGSVSLTNYSEKGVNTANAIEIKVTGRVVATGTDTITGTMFTVELI